MRKKIKIFLVLIIGQGFATSLSAQGYNEDQQIPELIILLTAGQETPSPEEIVERAGQSLALPDGLNLGDPVAARFVIAQRAQGPTLERFQQEPDTPGALLQRYVTLTYPDGVDMDEVKEALSRNPHVMWVGRNEPVHLSTVIPNDPLFPNTDGLGNPIPPDEHQWGSHALELSEAWEYTTGHAYVGIIDTGIDTDHEDFIDFDAFDNYVGGNFRAHLSHDFGYDDDNVDEGERQEADVTIAGHGTHVAGIVGATAGNGNGVTGTCWDCSLIVSKVSQLCPGFPFCPPNSNLFITMENAVEGINWAVNRGAQVLNLSLGWGPNDAPDCGANPLHVACAAVAHAEERDAVIVAASGNDGTNQIDWPASDDRALAAGGLEPVIGPFGSVVDVTLWDDCMGQGQCSSNTDPEQFVTPAHAVLSTFYQGKPYFPNNGCDDSLLPGHPGYGPCSGTSMASPYLAGATGLLRSINPQLSKYDIEASLLSNVAIPAGWDPQNGYGKPDIAGAARDVLGVAGGLPLANRLTPLFKLYSPDAECHFSTTVPQMATAALHDSESPFNTYYLPVPRSPNVPGYSIFPGAVCQVGPCIWDPRASVYIFTTDREPFPGAPPLVPLYRMSYDHEFNGNPLNRSFFYTTETAGLELGKQIDYRLDGIEGYIYQRCNPDCIPDGAVRLYRLYNHTRDDYALFPETELADYQAAGYVSVAGLNDWIGYVYLNEDSDNDHLIDGFEGLIGTDPNAADSDLDGITDGDEVLVYPYEDPLGGNLMINPGFENGTTAPFDLGVHNGTLQVETDPQHVRTGSFSLRHQATLPKSHTKPALGSNLVDITPLGADTFRFAAWVKAATPNTLVRLYLFGKDQNGDTGPPYYIWQDFSVGTDWEELSILHIRQPGFPFLAVRVDVRDEGGLVWWDDLRLEPVDNLLSDPGFELGTTPFSGVSNGDLIVDTAAPHKGLRSLRHRAGGPDSYTQPYFGPNASGLSPVLGTEKFRLSAWSKTQTNNLSIQLYLFGLDESFYPVEIIAGGGIATPNWEFFSKDYQPATGVRYISFRLDNNGGAGAIVRWDDLVLERIPQ